MSNKPQTLTEAQETLLNHVRDGGTITRSKEALAGKGYFAPGIKMLLPNTVKRLLDLGIVDLVDDGEDEETYGWTGKILDSETGEVIEVAESDEPEMVGVHPDLLMWVGTQNYRTIDDFVAEAVAQGVSKRVSRIPADLIQGETRVYLAHDEGQTGDGVIFGYFTVDSVEVIDIDEDEELPEIANQVIRFLGEEDLALESERGCGYRKDHGAMYLCAYDNIDPVEAVQGVTQIAGPLVLFDRPRDLEAAVGKVNRFRGYARIDRTDVNRAPMRQTPLELAREQILQETPKELVGLPTEPSRRWTEEERVALIALVKRMGSTTEAFRTFSNYTGRTVHGITYQWYMKLADRAKEEEK